MRACAHALWLGCALLGASVTALADPDHELARRLRDEGVILPLQEILSRAAFRPVQVLDVELEQEDGRYIYEIEVLEPGGRVWRVKLDARDGHLLSQRPHG